jgi:hypothetical protein
MNQFTFSRVIGLSIGVSATLGTVLVGGCSGGGTLPGESTVSTPSVGQSEEALRARRCDGRRDRQCAEGQYCNGSKEGLCPGKRQAGVCATEPQICPDIFKPVCGCDGNTYPNSCNAAAAGVAVEHEGQCAKQQTCGGIAGIPCPGGGKCVDDPSDDCDPANGGADCGGICACVERVLCIRGDHFDADPSVCACVPDVTPPPSTCGTKTCPAGQTCCNASCGTCAPPGVACSQIACTTN